MTVYRTRPLPCGRARGALVVPESVIEATTDMLREFGARGTRHEGLVYWTGRVVGGVAYVLSAISPRCYHGPQHVVANESEIGAVARESRRYHLGLIAQVHSHPGSDTRHSDGDDDLVLLPFEGMFSLVVASYGGGSLRPSEGAGLHQFQDGRWVHLEDDALLIVPARTRVEGDGES